MKKVLSFILSTAILIVCISCFTGCNNSDSVVGKWRGYECTNVYEPAEREFELFEDGSCDGFNSPYYEVNDNGTIVFLDKYHYENVTYNYILEGNKLWITNVKHGRPDTSSNLCFERVN